LWERAWNIEDFQKHGNPYTLEFSRFQEHGNSIQQQRRSLHMGWEGSGILKIPIPIEVFTVTNDILSSGRGSGILKNSGTREILSGQNGILTFGRGPGILYITRTLGILTEPT
jgi:hypothetical protein